MKVDLYTSAEKRARTTADEVEAPSTAGASHMPNTRHHSHRSEVTLKHPRHLVAPYPRPSNTLLHTLSAAVAVVCLLCVRQEPASLMPQEALFRKSSDRKVINYPLRIGIYICTVSILAPVFRVAQKGCACSICRHAWTTSRRLYIFALPSGIIQP
jgi:hypothetical protein